MAKSSGAIPARSRRRLKLAMLAFRTVGPRASRRRSQAAASRRSTGRTRHLPPTNLLRLGNDGGADDGARRGPGAGCAGLPTFLKTFLSRPGETGCPRQLRPGRNQRPRSVVVDRPAVSRAAQEDLRRQLQERLSRSTRARSGRPVIRKLRDVRIAFLALRRRAAGFAEQRRHPVKYRLSLRDAGQEGLRMANDGSRAGGREALGAAEADETDRQQWNRPASERLTAERRRPQRRSRRSRPRPGRALISHLRARTCRR